MRKGGPMGRLARMWNRENAVPKLIAFVLAVLLWFVAGAGTTDTPSSVLAPSAKVVHGVAVQVLYDEGAVVPVGGQPQVDLTLRGTRLDLMSPLLGGIRAFVDARGLGAGVYELPVQLENVPSGILYDPVYATVRLERAASRQIQVTVRTTGTPKSGFAVGTMSSSPAQVTVSGPAEEVNRVAAVVAQVSVDGADHPVKGRVPVAAVDSQGQSITSLRIEPDSVDLAVAVDAQSKVVPVTVELRNAPAGDLAVESWSVQPNNVTVTGPPDVLSRIDQVTGTVDVSGITGDRTFTVRLNVPDGVRAIQPETIQVAVHVVPGKTTKAAQVPVRVVGLEPGAQATVNPPEVSVTISGSTSHITAMQTSDLTATVDVTGKGPGTYTVPVAVKAPPWATLDDVPSVQVTITAPPPAQSAGGGSG
ncbi:MAG: hypothetical protein IMX06_07725 [Kyrpidia tusciae]|nr:CdaR family protein [Kyrpidia tusciae]MBE3552733.1 hypothetical protein [Kyrpidia tusciae]